MDLMALRRGLLASMAIGNTANINGKKFDCGTFTFESDTSDTLTINHNLGVYPEALFIWSYNFPMNPDNKNFAMIGGMKFQNVDSSDNAGYAHTANNHYTFGSTSSSMAWSATTTSFTIRTSSTYPWRTGYTYQWLAIGGNAE